MLGDLVRKRRGTLVDGLGAGGATSVLAIVGPAAATPIFEGWGVPLYPADRRLVLPAPALSPE